VGGAARRATRSGARSASSLRRGSAGPSASSGASSAAASGASAGALTAACAGALLVAATSGCGPGAGARDAPAACVDAPPAGANVLMITVDTLRADRLAPYGYRRPSPAFERLAEDSVVFDAAQSTTSWTLPALASLMTSYHASTHGVWTFQSVLDASFDTLAERLAAVGYDTAGVASHVFLGREFGLTQGFTHFDDDLVQQIELSHLAITSDGVTERGVRFIENKAAARDAGVDDTPWFLWLHYFDPHHVYFEHPDFAYGAGDSERYDSEVAFTDRAIGRLLDALERSGSDADTVVVFTSDHGEEFGDHGRAYHGITLYREVLRVPLMLRVPGVEPRRVEGPVSLVDVLPTLLESLGVVHDPDALGGVSLVPQLSGAPVPERAILGELRRTPDDLVEALVTSDWKLVRPLGAREGVELFDRRTDPTETTDVAHRHPGLLRELVDTLEGQVADAHERGKAFGHVPRHVGADMAEALQALGYIEGGVVGGTATEEAEGPQGGEGPEDDDAPR